MFHGSAPNTSSSCRMAQFLKAFPRSKSFPAEGGSSNEGNSGDAVVEGGISCEESVPALSVFAPSRLMRRAVAVKREMDISDSLSCVTPLGCVLFGLDVLEQEVTLTETALVNTSTTGIELIP